MMPTGTSPGSRNLSNGEVPDHQRCIAMSRARGKRCKKYRLKGDVRCKTHSKIKNRKLKKVARNRYSAFAGPVLNKLLEEVAKGNENNMTPEGYLDLSHEIELARASAVGALKLFNAVNDPDNKDKVTAQQRFMAVEAIQRAVKSVADTAEKSARILSALPSLYDAKIAQHFVSSIQAILEDVLDEKTCGLIVTRMKEIQLPGREQEASIKDAKAIVKELDAMQQLGIEETK